MRDLKVPQREIPLETFCDTLNVLYFPGKLKPPTKMKAIHYSIVRGEITVHVNGRGQPKLSGSRSQIQERGFKGILF